MSGCCRGGWGPTGGAVAGAAGRAVAAGRVGAAGGAAAAAAAAAVAASLSRQRVNAETASGRRDSGCRPTSRRAVAVSRMRMRTPPHATQARGCGRLARGAGPRRRTPRTRRRLAEADARAQAQARGCGRRRACARSHPRTPGRTPPDPAPYREHEVSAFGPLARVRIPGAIAGLAPRWRIPAGPLGTHPPTWPQPMPSR